MPGSWPRIGSSWSTPAKTRRSKPSDSGPQRGSGEPPPGRRSSTTISISASKLAKFKETKAFLERECAAWNPRPIFDITRLDCAHLIRKIADRAPAQARNCRGVGSAFFSWAISTGFYPGLEHNPFAAIKPKELIGAKVVRQRVLSDDELRVAWKAADDEGYPFGPLVKLWILTAQRKLEWGQARWSEIQPRRTWRDDRTVEPSLVIPASRMKNDGGHLVPLVPAVVDILRTIPEGEEGDFIFSASAGATAINGYSKDWDQFCVQMLRPHLSGITPQTATLAISRTTPPRKKGKDVYVSVKGDLKLTEDHVGRIIAIRHHADRWGFLRVVEVLGDARAKVRIIVSFGDVAPSSEWVIGGPEFTIHDFRRTSRTHMSALPVEHLVKELCIAHRKKGLDKVYDLHLYADEKRRCLSLLADRLLGIVEPPLGDNIVPLRTGTAT
jgi:integrase